MADLRVALDSKPKTKAGYWGDDEKFYQYRGGALRRPPMEIDLWERAKRATLADKRRNEILMEIRSVHEGKSVGGLSLIHI